jgi:V/A-type H+-transporting ATPase subunit I
MIVPMKKVALVVLERERDGALRSLRKLGVLHVERRDAASPGITELQGRIARLDQAHSILVEHKGPRVKTGATDLSAADALSVADRVLDLKKGLEDAKEAVRRLDAELERLEPWGAVDPADFSWLSERGIALHPCEIPIAELANLGEDVKYLEISRDRRTARCVLWTDGEFSADRLPQGARELILPSESTAAIREARAERLRRIPEIEVLLAAEARHGASLIKARKAAEKDLEFETVRAGMPAISFGEGSSIAKNAELAWLSGFVPVSDERSLAEEAKKRGWGYLARDPDDDDLVPTKLKNNPIVNIISPLLGFLGVLPGYHEIDISLWFLLFFGLFFAMIFGDGGYGAIILVASLFGIISRLRKGERVPTAYFMFLYLAAMTVGWGVITCTWFGLPVETLPAFLKGIALPAFSNANPDAPSNVKMFCFVIALIQLSLAHVIGIIRNIRSPKALGELGTLLMLCGMFVVVLNLLVDAKRYPISDAVLATIATGFVLNFVFNNYAGSVLGSVLESLKNFITVILGVVNVFGDIMSYIRLWAVGLAGAAISATVNSMVGPMFGSFFMFLAVLVLFFGHGLNLMMNVLSVIVHGVRLNTLEFSNHLGLTWSGFKYEPFSETGKE